MIATGFSVLLGFLIFLAFESYDASRSGAETEALTVAQQVETAQRLPADVREDLTGQLVCYARWVVNVEWDQMEDGTLDDQLNPWGPTMFSTLARRGARRRRSRSRATTSGSSRPRPASSAGRIGSTVRRG